MWNLILYQQFFRDMQKHKLRSFLAIFGIVWGTVAVVMLLAIGEGFYQANQKNMQMFSPGALLFYAGETSKPYHGLPSRRMIHMKAEDISSFKKALPAIRFITPVLGKSQPISYAQNKTSGWINAVDVSDQILEKQVITRGRFLNAIDIKNQDTVVVLGHQVKNKLFKSGNALGKKIAINNISFTVIGVLKKNTMNAFRDNTLILPYTTAIKLWGNQDLSQFLVQPYGFRDTTFSAIFLQSFKIYLSHYYHFAPDDTAAIRTFNFSKEAAFFTHFFRGIELFLGFCGLLTLGVAAIGIANVMFLIVNERQAEIGLRMALGARPRDIFMQFLLETSLIIFLGGFIGFLLSWGGIFLLQHLSLPDWLGRPEFSMKILGATFILLSLVGLLAAYFPARRAANLQPIEALAF